MAGDQNVVGLVGARIEASLSPALHEREAAELGLDYRYKLLDIEQLGIPVDEFGDVLADARSAGMPASTSPIRASRSCCRTSTSSPPDAAALER